MSARDFLERLRPSATPGAPASAGVPADRVAERSAELEGVLASLAGVQERAEQIRSDAHAEAERRRRAAREQARALVSEAQRRAQAERSATASAAHASGARQAEEILSGAETRALQIAARAAARQPSLVARVVEQARAEVATLAGTAP